MNLDDERICINVEGFSVEKKKLIQDAFFKLGYYWSANRNSHANLEQSVYTNTFVNGSFGNRLMHSYRIEKDYEHTFNELMERAGMNEHKEEIKLDDEITITTTYGALAKVYAVMGNVNGKDYNKNLWSVAQKVLDPHQEKYNEITLEIMSEDILNYASYQKEWEDLLFKPKETDTQKKARLLREEAEKMLQQAKELEDSL